MSANAVTWMWSWDSLYAVGYVMIITAKFIQTYGKLLNNRWTSLKPPGIEPQVNDDSLAAYTHTHTCQRPQLTVSVWVWNLIRTAFFKWSMEYILFKNYYQLCSCCRLLWNFCAFVVLNIFLKMAVITWLTQSEWLNSILIFPAASMSWFPYIYKYLK